MTSFMEFKSIPTHVDDGPLTHHLPVSDLDGFADKVFTKLEPLSENPFRWLRLIANLRDPSNGGNVKSGRRRTEYVRWRTGQRQAWMDGHAVGFPSNYRQSSPDADCLPLAPCWLPRATWQQPRGMQGAAKELPPSKQGSPADQLKQGPTPVSGLDPRTENHHEPEQDLPHSSIVTRDVIL